MIHTPATPEQIPRAHDQISSDASAETSAGATSSDGGLPAGLAVQAEGLSKCYRIYNHPRDRLLQALWGRDRRGRPKQFYREFWALQTLSFELGRGQTLGVVGRNGSGKSTLLQLLCGTLTPTTGTVQMRGRVGALLELGSGFNPEFNGLENVFLNASLLGLNQAETEARLDQILAFADIGEFIDQPVKTYSSGMAVRLAFAVQAHIDPDVLVVDEALAVGDELFQKKCYAHLERLKENGTSILLVTHSCGQIIQHCDQALLLHRGRQRLLAEPGKVTSIYQRLINASDAEWDAALNPVESQNGSISVTIKSTNKEKTAALHSASPSCYCEESPSNSITKAWFDKNLLPQSTEIYPEHGARITGVHIEAIDGSHVNTIPFEDDFNIVFSYEATKNLEKIAFSCGISNHTGNRITGQAYPDPYGAHPGGNISKVAQGDKWEVKYYFHNGFWPGIYFISGGILSCEGRGNFFVHRTIDIAAICVTENSRTSINGAAYLRKRSAEIKWI